MKESAELKILEYFYNQLGKKPFRSNGLRVRLEFFGFPDFEYYKYQSLANSMVNLKKSGFLKKDQYQNYFITDGGVQFFLKEKSRLSKVLQSFNFENKQNKSRPKNLLILYDIPQDKKSLRDWFRKNLIMLDFEMIQKSVWVGPSPLPRDFLEYIEELEADSWLKIFNLKGDYRALRKIKRK